MRLFILSVLLVSTSLSGVWAQQSPQTGGLETGCPANIDISTLFRQGLDHGQANQPALQPQCKAYALGYLEGQGQRRAAGKDSRVALTKPNTVINIQNMTAAALAKQMRNAVLPAHQARLDKDNVLTNTAGTRQQAPVPTERPTVRRESETRLGGYADSDSGRREGMGWDRGNTRESADSARREAMGWDNKASSPAIDRGSRDDRAANAARADSRSDRGSRDDRAANAARADSRSDRGATDDRSARSSTSASGSNSSASSGSSGRGGSVGSHGVDNDHGRSSSAGGSGGRSSSGGRR